MTFNAPEGLEHQKKTNPSIPHGAVPRRPLSSPALSSKTGGQPIAINKARVKEGSLSFYSDYVLGRCIAVGN
jgi:hypothetical protein